MYITHVALWTSHLDEMKDFYVRYFGGQPNKKYHNPHKSFESYFITFPSGARLELMRKPTVLPHSAEVQIGWSHIAIAVGSRERVDALTETLRTEGYRVVSEPRVTGDGYYESVVADPDGNPVEITV